MNHKLGEDHAGFAILFPELNAQLNTLFSTLSAADLAAYTFHVDAGWVVIRQSPTSLVSAPAMAPRCRLGAA